MFVQALITEIEGIMILLTRSPKQEELVALNAIEEKELIEYRNSLAQEYELMNKNKKILLLDKSDFE
jgi:hypothetical protein